MADAPVRIVLLGRAGEAREHLRKALVELGAVLVAEGDPTEMDPASVAGSQPDVVMVSLEPAIEDALERFDGLLSAPGVNVMYDDAEVTSKLDGWDLARWARHLAAKLVGADLLPPVPENTGEAEAPDLMPVPGAPPTPASLMDGERLEDYAAEATGMVDDVPMTPLLTENEAPEPEALALDDDLSLDVDLSGIEEAMSRSDLAQAEAEAGEFIAAASPSAAEESFSLDVDLAGLESSLAGGGEQTLELADDGGQSSTLLADIDFESDAPVKFSSFSDGDDAAPLAVDDDVAALAAQLDALPEHAREVPRDPDFAITPLEEEPPAAKPKAGAAPSGPSRPAAPAGGGGLSFGDLNLVPIEDGKPLPPDAVPPLPKPKVEARSFDVSGLSLLSNDEAGSAAQAVPGVVLVLAGMGGPDAVRQLLGGLPSKLKVPFLLYQHLDAGKHDRLVGQLGKGSRLPLVLAEEGRPAPAGYVSVLRPEIGVLRGSLGLEFTHTLSLAALVHALPQSEAMVVILSGADPQVVDAVLELRNAGGTVLAQTPSTCFDPAAAQAVVDAGAESGPPAALANRITARWGG